MSTNGSQAPRRRRSLSPVRESVDLQTGSSVTITQKLQRPKIGKTKRQIQSTESQACERAGGNSNVETDGHTKRGTSILELYARKHTQTGVSSPLSSLTARNHHGRRPSRHTTHHHTRVAIPPVHHIHKCPAADVLNGGGQSSRLIHGSRDRDQVKTSSAENQSAISRAADPVPSDACTKFRPARRGADGSG